MLTVPLYDVTFDSDGQLVAAAGDGTAKSATPARSATPAANGAKRAFAPEHTQSITAGG
jgi:hypothetical protein